MSSEMRRVVWRLEFPQPPGWRIQWLGPYTSQWLTAEAEEIVRYMEAEHCATHPHPSDPTIFAAYPGDVDHLGCLTRVDLRYGDHDTGPTVPTLAEPTPTQRRAFAGRPNPPNPEVARTPHHQNSETPAQQGFHALHDT